MIQPVDRTEILSIGSVNLQIRHTAPQRNLNPIPPISDGIATNSRPDSVGAGSFSDELNGLMDARMEKEKNSFLGNTLYETTFYHAFPSFPMLSPLNIVQVEHSRNGVENSRNGVEGRGEVVRGESLGVRQSGDEGIQSGIRRLTTEPINDAAPTMVLSAGLVSTGSTRRSLPKSEGNQTDALQSPPVQSETVKKPAMEVTSRTPSNDEGVLEVKPAGEMEMINQNPPLSPLLKGGIEGGFGMEKLASHEKGNTNPETMKPGGQKISDSWNLRDPTDPESFDFAQDKLRPSARPEGPSRPLEAVIEGKYPANRFSEVRQSSVREGPELHAGAHWGREIPDHSILPSGARVLLHPPQTPLHGGEGVGSPREINRLSLSTDSSFIISPGENGKIPVRTPESSGAHFDMGKGETQGDSERGRDASGKGGENIPITDRGFQPSRVLPEVVPSTPVDHPVRAELVQRLAAEIRLNLYQGNNELEIKLQPEHLGKLKIKILEKENVFTIEIKTAHSDVKGILEQGLSALKQNLEGAGVAVGSFNVLLENGSGGAPYNPLWREAQGRGDAGARGRGGEGARGRGSAVRRATTGEGIVNILV